MTILIPWLTRSLGTIRKAAPYAYGWCRTRWRCATRAATRQAKHGIAVAAETVRRWLHEMGWVWPRATRVAKDDAPHRIERLARIRLHHENLLAHAMMVFADALDIHLLPKVGAAWMPQGTQAEILTPGKPEKHSLAGALHLATGTLLYGLGPRKNNGRFRELLTLLDSTDPARQISRIYVVADNYCIPKAKAVAQWLAAHPRFAVLWWPTYGPRANPMERAFGDGHDKCPRTHKQKRLRALVQDVEQHVQENGPWQYKLSQLYDTPEVTAAIESIAAEKQPKLAA
jgi:DDE superfamily endonuclease/winged helix-turn-helix protein